MALSGSITTSYWTSSDSGQTRGYTLSWTATQSIANNQSTISWTLSTSGSYKYTVAERTLYVVLAGKVLVNKTDRVMRGAGTVASGSFTVGHDSSGNCSISGSIQAAVYTSAVNCTASGSWSLDTIPRKANITGADSVTDEENPYFTFSNPGGFGMYAELEVNPNNEHLFKRNVPNTGAFTFELTEDERNILRGYLKNANSGTLRYLLYSNGGSWVSYVDKTLTITNAKPTIQYSVKDVNEKTLAVTNDESVFIRYYSNAEVSVSATAYKQAEIKNTKVICGSQNLTESNGIIYGVDSGNFVFSATDSRGNTVSDSKQVTFIEYIKLTCDLLAKAPTTDGDLSFAISGNYYNNSFGTTDNDLVVEYCYSENGGEYSEWFRLDGVTFADNKYSVSVVVEGLDYRSSYVVKARATDKLMEVQTESKSLKAIPVCDWGENDFNFNVPVTIQGINVGNTLAELNSNLQDYIIDQGSLDIWTYRKWHSGIAECWARIVQETISVSESWGAVYSYDDAIKPKNYPFSFSEIPTVTFGTELYGNNYWLFTGTKKGTLTTSPSVSVCRPTPASVIPTINIHVIGRWK